MGKRKKSAVIAYAHMMKTAGTAFSKNLIYYYGRNFHQVPGGLSLQDFPLDWSGLQFELNRKGRKLHCIAGHSVRPFADFETFDNELTWITFFRDPHKRFVSHYLHDKYYRPSHFKHVQNGKSIVDWMRKYDETNYQTRFIAGEPNLEKAIDIINTKFSFVGITERFVESLSAFSNLLGLDDFPNVVTKTNSSKAPKEESRLILDEFSDMIHDVNRKDALLYDYILNEVYPRQLERIEAPYQKTARSKLPFIRFANELRTNYNFWDYHIFRQRYLRTEKLTRKNITRFINRWW